MIIVNFGPYSELELYKGVTNFTVKAVNYNTAEVHFMPPPNNTCIKVRGRVKYVNLTRCQRAVSYKVSGGGQDDQDINDNGKEVNLGNYPKFHVQIAVSEKFSGGCCFQ
jgi:hypothetical protein